MDNPTAIIRFSISPLGFKSMRLSANKPASFIESYTNDLSMYTIFKRADVFDYTDDFECTVTEVMNKKIASGSTYAMRM